MYYKTSTITGVLRLAPQNDVSAGISKSMLNKQATIKLAFGDILYGNTYRMDVKYFGQNNGFVQKFDTRNATLSFSYRFGRTITAARKRSTSSEEEKDRAI